MQSSNRMGQRDRISRSLIQMMREEPFFSHMVMCHDIREIPDGKDGKPAGRGIVMNGKVLAFNGGDTEKLTDQQLVTALKKGALKIALGHHLRAAGYADTELLADNPISEREVLNLLNRAGDLSTNDLLRQEAMPDDWLKPEALSLEGNHPMEYYYVHFREQYVPPPPQNDGEGEGDGDSGEGGTGGGGSALGGPNGPEGGEDTPPEAETPPTGGQTPSGGDSGEDSGDDSDGEGGQNGPPPPAPPGQTPPQVPVDVAPAPGGEKKQAENEQEWLQMVASSALAAEQAGKIAGWLKQLVSHALQPAEVSWKDKLRQFARKNIPHGRSTYSRPHRRQSWTEDIMIPSKVGRTVELVAFITDTSCSMNVESCNLGLNEMSEIMTAFPRSKLTHIQCDTRVASMVTWGPNDRMAVTQFMRSPEWAGRGGTDMTPAFEQAAKLRPQCIICLTDGYLPDWPKQSAVPVFWLMTTDIKPPYGEHARMKGEQ